MSAQLRLLPIAAAIATLVVTACSDAVTAPTSSSAFSPTALHSGSANGGGGGGGGGGSVSGGGGGSTQVIPQIGGTWHGHEHYDSTLAVFFPFPGQMDPAMAMRLVEDAAGNISGVDDVMHVAMSGKASSNGNIVLQDGTYYGQKLTVSISGSVACSDGSTGTVVSGKFQRKEGFGTLSVDNCPIVP